MRALSFLLHTHRDDRVHGGRALSASRRRRQEKWETHIGRRCCLLDIKTMSGGECIDSSRKSLNPTNVCAFFIFSDQKNASLFYILFSEFIFLMTQIAIIKR